MVYAPAARTVLRFGGDDGVSWRSDTWSYGPLHPAELAAYGAGCAGSAGVPSLSFAGLPWLGDTFSVEVAPVAAALPVAIAFGCSDRAWGGVTLPLLLDPLGMPGCVLWTSVEALVAATNQMGVARQQFAIAPLPALLGLDFFTQAVQLDPAANAAGLVLSDAGAGVVGGR